MIPFRSVALRSLAIVVAGPALLFLVVIVVLRPRALFLVVEVLLYHLGLLVALLLVVPVQLQPVALRDTHDALRYQAAKHHGHRRTKNHQHRLVLQEIAQLKG